MKNRIGNIIIFVLSLTALVVSLILLKVYGAYEIEYGGGSVVIDGGWFMVIMNVIRLIALFITTAISGVKLYKSFKKE